jgi:hypothetical protein
MLTTQKEAVKALTEMGYTVRDIIRTPKRVLFIVSVFNHDTRWNEFSVLYLDAANESIKSIHQTAYLNYEYCVKVAEETKDLDVLLSTMTN